MVITECLPILIYDGLLTLDCDLGIYSDESLRDIYFEFIMTVTHKKEWEKINFISSSGSHSSIEYRKGFLSACDPEPFKQKGYCWKWSRVHYREVRGDRPYSPKYKYFARIVFGGTTTRFDLCHWNTMVLDVPQEVMVFLVCQLIAWFFSDVTVCDLVLLLILVGQWPWCWYCCGKVFICDCEKPGITLDYDWKSSTALRGPLHYFPSIK